MVLVPGVGAGAAPPVPGTCQKSRKIDKLLLAKIDKLLSALIFLLCVGHTGHWVAFSQVCSASVSSSGFGRKSSKFAQF